MKKILVVIALLAVTGFTTKSIAQEFGGAMHVGYLTEIETVGFGGSLLYEFNKNWGVAAGGTFAVRSGEEDLRWIAADLDVHYTFFEGLYALAGGQYLSMRTKKNEVLNGFVTGESIETNSDFGANLGAGYRYNLMDNVSVYTEIKYVTVASGYMDARLGLHFGF
jgi:opacity protein-like surface antigen